MFCPPTLPRVALGTFGNKRACPAERGGAAGGGVAAQERLGLVDKEAFLLRRGGLHGEHGRLGGLGAGCGCWAHRAGAHRQRQLVTLQLWGEERKGKLTVGKLHNGVTSKPACTLDFKSFQPTLSKR